MFVKENVSMSLKKYHWFHSIEEQVKLFQSIFNMKQNQQCLLSEIQWFVVYFSYHWSTYIFQFNIKKNHYKSYNNQYNNDIVLIIPYHIYNGKFCTDIYEKNYFTDNLRGGSLKLFDKLSFHNPVSLIKTSSFPWFKVNDKTAYLIDIPYLCIIIIIIIHN